MIALSFMNLAAIVLAVSFFTWKIVTKQKKLGAALVYAVPARK
ncbi:MAG TPA: hypothetical protein VEL31_30395 [Ktedonobacteraceae bacterium]|nr:hypothetical protein [Ktedonobacteraceae bacterium]